MDEPVYLPGDERPRCLEYDRYPDLRRELDLLADLHAIHRTPFEACAAMVWPASPPPARGPRLAVAPQTVAGTDLAGVRHPLRAYLGNTLRRSP
jgi:hypothetical protein